MDFNTPCPVCLYRTISFSKKVKAKYLKAQIKCPKCESILVASYRLKEKVVVGLISLAEFTLALFLVFWLFLNGKSFHFFWPLFVLFIFVEIWSVWSTKLVKMGADTN